MIKLFSLKQQKKEELASGTSSAGKRKATAAQLRLTKGYFKITNVFSSLLSFEVIYHFIKLVQKCYLNFVF